MTYDRKIQDAEIFRRETAALGGPIPRDSLPAPVKAAYDEVAERAEDLIACARGALDRLPPIHFDFIHNAAINAVAFRADGRYFIGINTGTLFMLRMVIGRMLADPRAFPSIGDPSEEVGDLKPMQDYRPNADAILRTNRLLKPRNAIRRAYADALEEQALMFFIGHEIAHISRGHVDYLLETRRTPQLSEFGAKDETLRLERQSLELDADRCSVQSRIGSLWVTQQQPNYTGPPWAPGDNGPRHLMRLWSVALSILFQLFGDVRFSGSELSEANYPPLPIRWLQVEMYGLWLIDTKWDAGLKAVAIDAINQGRDEAADAFSTILGQTVTLDGFVQATTPSAKDHAMRLHEYWESTLDELRSYSYEL